ncbi:MAG: hypothetical protein JWO31_1667 [Phycisphaerales bacterium]|nr:hypothetical protein [Phycisphaerales bacterium]
MFAGGFGFCGLDVVAYLLSLLAVPAGVYLLALGLSPSRRASGSYAEALAGLVLLAWGVWCRAG